MSTHTMTIKQPNSTHVHLTTGNSSQPSPGSSYYTTAPVDSYSHAGRPPSNMSTNNAPSNLHIPQSVLHRQFSTDLTYSPMVTGSATPTTGPIGSSTSLYGHLHSPQVSSNIPALGLSQAYIQQLASPQTQPLQIQRHTTDPTHNVYGSGAGAGSTFLPPPTIQKTLDFSAPQQLLSAQPTTYDVHAHNSSIFGVPPIQPPATHLPPTLSTALLNKIQAPVSQSSFTGVPHQQNHQSHATQSHSYPPPCRSINDRPVVKLTQQLMTTYNGINTKYYEVNKHKRREKDSAHSLQQTPSTSASTLVRQQTAPTAPQDHNTAAATSTAQHSTHDIAVQPPTSRGGLHNNGMDDKDYNLLLEYGEHIGVAGRYVVESSIGKGSFGRVVKCYDTQTNTYVAVKIVKSKSAFYRQAQVELHILRTLSQHPSDTDRYNIVQMLDSFLYYNHQCIVFELLSLNLYELLKNTSFKGVSLKLVAKFAHQLLQTLWYLSSDQIQPLPPPTTDVRITTNTQLNNTLGTGRRVLHCDLKPENILLRSVNKSTIKIIDFGSACFDRGKTFTYIQSRFYRAPEILLGLQYNESIDMFSLGCILYELHIGKPLFDGLDEVSQVYKHIEVLGLPPRQMLQTGRSTDKYFERVFDTVNGSYVYKPKKAKHIRSGVSLRTALADKLEPTPIYDLFIDFLSRMLEYDPDQRIKPAEALQHPFLAAIASTSSTAGANTASARSGYSQHTATTINAPNAAATYSAAHDDKLSGPYLHKHPQQHTAANSIPIPS